MPEQPDRPADRPVTADRPVIIVSACLLGVQCNHRGQGQESEAVRALGAMARLVGVCPEVAGGLGTPRDASERRADGRVVTGTGVDVTAAYEKGATHTLAVALAMGAKRAVLKARSPSCGTAGIYDGSFTRLIRPGLGVTAEILADAGLSVCSEDDL